MTQHIIEAVRHAIDSGLDRFVKISPIKATEYVNCVLGDFFDQKLIFDYGVICDDKNRKIHVSIKVDDFKEFVYLPVYFK